MFAKNKYIYSYMYFNTSELREDIMQTIYDVTDISGYWPEIFPK